EQDADVQTTLLFHDHIPGSISDNIEQLFVNCVAFEMEKFSQVSREDLWDYDNIFLIANSDSDVVRFLSKICEKRYGLGFDYDSQFRSIKVTYKGQTFNYSTQEKLQRKLFAIFMMVPNPFGSTPSKLWLLLYGKKFNIEEGIQDFIEMYCPVFKEMRPETNQFYVLKFDLDEKNVVKKIPVLNRKYVASFLR
ncbi:MAG: hypothetical protein ACXAD7_22665, partial [Candidatus Kariarchaeaceae archaeon]